MILTEHFPARYYMTVVTAPRGESSEGEGVRSRGLGADGVSLIPFLGSATVCRLTDVLSWHGPAPNARTHFSVPASPNSRRGAAQGLKRTLAPSRRSEAGREHSVEAARPNGA